MVTLAPDLSFIVSSFSWVDQLPTCLYSLRAQTHQNFEVLVTDNSTDKRAIAHQKAIVRGMRDKRFRYLNTAPLIKVSDCYWSSEVGMKHTTGRWLCFPAEDCYYPPEWAARMLSLGIRKQLDLVLCELVIAGPAGCGSSGYFIVDLPEMGMPGYKPSFIVRREKFKGWINKPTVPACSGTDRTTLEYLRRRGDIRWAYCHGLYYAHG
jgi:glycosyltransferase involved in cell wall biosynthesis